MRDHQGRALTAAVQTVLTNAGLLVGAGEAPTGSGWQGDPSASAFKPYVALYPMGGRLDGSIDYGAEDVDAMFQLTCVGSTQEQAEWCADTARVALLSTNPTVDGRFIGLVSVDSLGTAVRDDHVQPPVWFIADRFAVMTSPA